MVMILYKFIFPVHHGDLQRTIMFNMDQSDLLPAEGVVVYADVSHVCSPSLFYVTLPFGPHSVCDVDRKTHGTPVYS